MDPLLIRNVLLAGIVAFVGEVILIAVIVAIVLVVHPPKRPTAAAGALLTVAYGLTLAVAFGVRGRRLAESLRARE